MQTMEIEEKGLAMNILKSILERVESFLMPSEDLRLRIGTVAKEAYFQAHDDAEKQLNMNVDFDPEKVSLMAEMTFNDVVGMSKDIATDLRREFHDGMIKGESIGQLASRVKSVFDVTDSRAEMIARTTMTKVANTSRIEAYRKSGVVKKVEWITARDDKVCPTCKANTGTYPITKFPRPATDTHPNCFDDQTEILTEFGWKKFKNLTKEERVYTLNVESNILELQKPINYVEYDSDGSILTLNHRTIDIAATKDHDMLIIENGKIITRTFEQLAARTGAMVMPMQTEGVFVDSYPDQYVIPSVNRAQYGETGELKFDIEDWSSLLGIFLAEGSVTINEDNGNYKVALAACKIEEKDAIRELLERMNINFYEAKTGFDIMNKQLAYHMKELSKGAENKTIPDYVFGWDKELIDNFLNWYHIGDGSLANWGARRIWTTSPMMADQLQILFILTGKDASITVTKRNRFMQVCGRTCFARDLYCVQEKISRMRGFRGTQIKEIPYTGKVYCVQVPNETIVVRRNKKTIITKNCRCQIVPSFN